MTDTEILLEQYRKENAELKNQLALTTDFINKISHGDNVEKITATYDGEFEKTKQDINKLTDVLKFVNTELNRISTAAADGNLDVRADLSEVDGIWRSWLENQNRVMEAFETPITELLDVLERLAHNDFSTTISGNYNGRYRELGSDLNNIIKTTLIGAQNIAEKVSLGDISDLEGLRQRGALSAEDRITPIFIAMMENIRDFEAELDRFADEQKEGDIEARCHPERLQGVYGDLARGVNGAFDATSVPLIEALGIMGRYAEGDLTQEMRTLPGKQIALTDGINGIRKNVKALVDETKTLAEAAINGNLKYRADAGKHKGDYAEVVQGVNDACEAFISPIREAIRVCGEYAEGNFTARVDDRLRVSGDLVAFKDAMNKIGVQVSGTVTDVNKISTDVRAGTEEVGKGADEIARAAEGVATTSQKCADLTRDLKGRMEEVVRAISDLSASNEEIASTSQDVLNRAQNVAEMGEGAHNLGKNANTKMGAVEEISRESVDDIEKLNNQMKEINNIVKLINDIANQTNLLALNAAIEAARAGEHGRGFAVVAGEIRNLAGESKQASQNIEELIGSILNNSNKTAVNMKKAYDEIGEGVGSVNKAIEALDGIVKGAEQVTLDMGEIAKAIEDQANTANNAVTSAEEGGRLMNENQAQIEELAALAEEASASIEEIGSAVHEVENMTDTLSQNMSRFRV